MTELQSKLSNLIERIENFKKTNQTQAESIKNLEKEVENSVKIIENQKQLIEDLNNQIKITKLASEKATELQQENEGLKQKINECIREIDQCMVLLSE